MYVALLPTGGPPVMAGYCDQQTAARYSSLSIRMIRKLIAEGRLPAYKVGARTLIRYSDLDALILEGGDRSAGPSQAQKGPYPRGNHPHC